MGNARFLPALQLIAERRCTDDHRVLTIVLVAVGVPSDRCSETSLAVQNIVPRSLQKLGRDSLCGG